MANVPCAGCRLCCQREAVLLQPELGDDVESYETVRVPTTKGKLAWVLKQKPNGDCHYLGEHGCTIHDRVPVMCRAFDCREIYAQYNRDQRRRLVRQGQLRQDILDAGRDRIASWMPLRKTAWKV